MTGEAPTVLSLFLCKRIIEDKGTSNRSYIDVMDRHTSDRIPARPIDFIVCAEMSDISGPHEVVLCVYDPDGESLGQVVQDIVVENALKTIHLVVAINKFTFKKTGFYTFAIAIDEFIVATRKIKFYIEPKSIPAKPAYIG